LRRSPDPLAGFNGPTFNGGRREGKGEWKERGCVMAVGGDARPSGLQSGPNKGLDLAVGPQFVQCMHIA